MLGYQTQKRLHLWSPINDDNNSRNMLHKHVYSDDNLVKSIYFIASLRMTLFRKHSDNNNNNNLGTKKATPIFIKKGNE